MIDLPDGFDARIHFLIKLSSHGIQIVQAINLTLRRGFGLAAVIARPWSSKLISFPPGVASAVSCDICCGSLDNDRGNKSARRLTSLFSLLSRLGWRSCLLRFPSAITTSFARR